MRSRILFVTSLGFSDSRGASFLDTDSEEPSVFVSEFDRDRIDKNRLDELVAAQDDCTHRISQNMGYFHSSCEDPQDVKFQRRSMEARFEYQSDISIDGGIRRLVANYRRDPSRTTDNINFFCNYEIFHRRYPDNEDLDAEEFNPPIPEDCVQRIRFVEVSEGESVKRISDKEAATILAIVRDLQLQGFKVGKNARFVRKSDGRIMLDFAPNMLVSRSQDFKKDLLDVFGDIDVSNEVRDAIARMRRGSSVLPTESIGALQHGSYRSIAVPARRDSGFVVDDRFVSPENADVESLTNLAHWKAKYGYFSGFGALTVPDGPTSGVSQWMNLIVSFLKLVRDLEDQGYALRDLRPLADIMVTTEEISEVRIVGTSKVQPIRMFEATKDGLVKMGSFINDCSNLFKLPEITEFIVEADALGLTERFDYEKWISIFNRLKRVGDLGGSGAFQSPFPSTYDKSFKSADQFEGLVVLPSNGMKPVATVFVLHGMCCRMGDLIELGEDSWTAKLGSRVKFIYLRAPRTNQLACANSPADGDGLWFDMITGIGQEMANRVFENLEIVDRESLDRSLSTIRKMMHKEAQLYNGDYSKLFLLGYSQGATMTEYVALTSPRRLGGAVSLGGFVPIIDLKESDVGKECGGTSIVHFHGTEDTDVPLTLAEKGYERVQNIGCLNYEFITRPGTHDLPADEMQTVANWLAKRIAINWD